MERSPPPGWRVWNEETDGQLVLAYRPDVFDSDAFPPACLPTITVARGHSPDQLPERRARSDAWFRAFFLEPTVRVRALDATYDTREAAVAGALDVAVAFAAGDVDHRGAYQVPREAYLSKLDELVGRDPDGSEGDRSGRGS